MAPVGGFPLAVCDEDFKYLADAGVWVLVQQALEVLVHCRAP